jgi:hypothetical protein
MQTFLGSIMAVLGFVFSDVDTDKPDYDIYFKVYHHAEHMAYTYSIKDDKLTVVSQGFLSDDEDELLLNIGIDSNFILKIQKLKLEELENNYYNKCILPTSGADYLIDIKDGERVKRIHLHHYYKEEVAKLADLINNEIPGEYEINYLDKDTVQNCK